MEDIISSETDPNAEAPQYPETKEDEGTSFLNFTNFASSLQQT